MVSRRLSPRNFCTPEGALRRGGHLALGGLPVGVGTFVYQTVHDSPPERGRVAGGCMGTLVMRPECQGGEGLVALGRQQQPLRVAPKAFALGASAEQIVEAERVVLQGAW
jgi:hypothetical protein